MKLKIVWLSNYPVSTLVPYIKINRNVKNYHPATWIVNLSKEIANREDTDFHLITQYPYINQKQILDIRNITFHVLKNGIPFINRGYPTYLPFDILSHFFLNVKMMLKEINRIDPHIIHTFGTEGPFSLTGIKSKYPCLISMQGIVSELSKVSRNIGFKLLKKYEEKAIKKNKYFDCRTHYDANFVRSLNNEAKIFKINRAVHPAYFKHHWRVNDSHTILYVGSLKRRKGIENLLESLPIVKKNYPNFCLTFIGTSNYSYLQYLKTLCIQLNIDKNVYFEGFKLASDIAIYHLNSQLFVFPSANDNSPNAVAEAMVSGMPIIASRVGGIPSMIKDGKTGILVDINDIKQTAEAINLLLQNPDKRERLGRNARRVARERHWPEQVAEKTIETYREILNLEKDKKTIAK